MNKLIAFFRKVKRVFLSPAFGKFVAVGFVNGFNSVLASYMFSLVLPVNLSFVFGYCMSITISYFLNSYFVFQRKTNVERFLKFCISYIPNFIIQNGCVFVMYNILKWHEIFAFTFAGIFAVPITYVLLNILTFKTVKRKNK